MSDRYSKLTPMGDQAKWTNAQLGFFPLSLSVEPGKFYLVKFIDADFASDFSSFLLLVAAKIKTHTQIVCDKTFLSNQDLPFNEYNQVRGRFACIRPHSANVISEKQFRVLWRHAVGKPYAPPPFTGKLLGVERDDI